jgi:hypothetical protein
MYIHLACLGVLCNRSHFSAAMLRGQTIPESVLHDMDVHHQWVEQQAAACYCLPSKYPLPSARHVSDTTAHCVQPPVSMVNL